MKIDIKKYTVEPKESHGGTEGSYGMETIEFEFDKEWEGLTKSITFYPPRRDAVTVSIESDSIPLPWEVTDRCGKVPYVVKGVGTDTVIRTRVAFISVLPTKKGDGDEPSDHPIEPTGGYIAGENITINGRTISAKDTTYTAGTGISISDENVISATGGGGAAYTAGANISISDENVISATDTTYSAGTGISISAQNEISSSVAGIPSGGTAGQVLAKGSSTDYDAGWNTIHEVPSGGTAGQVLSQVSSSDYDTAWLTISNASYVFTATYDNGSSSIKLDGATLGDVVTACNGGMNEVYIIYNGTKYRVSRAYTSSTMSYIYTDPAAYYLVPTSTLTFLYAAGATTGGTLYSISKTLS